MKDYVFGVDLGGTTVKMGLFSTSGELLENWEIPTVTENDGERILPDIAESIKAKMSEKGFMPEQILGVGIGVPGPVDKDGVVHRAVNLGWGQFNVARQLSELTGLTAKAGNDANVAALGEMWKGGGQGYQSLVAVTLGTGIGGGIIIDGKLLSGTTGAGGEIGHIHIEDDEEEACGCGNFGCLEEYASATGIVRMANRILERTTGDSVLRGEELSAKAVFDAVKEGDAVAILIAQEFGEILGKGLAMIATVINPEVFVIGGGVSKAGEILFEYICPAFEKYVFHGCKETKFTLATLGNDAGIYGAAKLVMEE
ncbi:MAG: ROK family glucokinase [Lachnospiraceae bacterium]|nr:ROK family glucokinase [Lachnospiraceae bacterium]